MAGVAEGKTRPGFLGLRYWGLSWGYDGVILGLYGVYIGVIEVYIGFILGLYWVYTGVIEVYIGVIWGFYWARDSAQAQSKGLTFGGS